VTCVFGEGIHFYIEFRSPIIFPIEFSAMLVYEVITLIEIFLCLYTMIYVGDRQGALFFLRNSAISNQNPVQPIKTSHEIEQELFYKFPYLRKNVKNENHNHNHNHNKNN